MCGGAGETVIDGRGGFGVGEIVDTEMRCYGVEPDAVGAVTVELSRADEPPQTVGSQQHRALAGTGARGARIRSAWFRSAAST